MNRIEGFTRQFVLLIFLFQECIQRDVVKKPLDVAHHFIAEGKDREGFELLKINDIIGMLAMHSEFS